MANEELHVGMLIKRLSGMLDRMSNSTMWQEDITRSQVFVLGELYGAEGHTLSFSKLKDRLDISQPGTWGLVRRLEAKDMVRTLADPKDARAKLVAMTDLGVETFEVARTHIDDFESMITAGIDAHELEVVKECLQRMYDNCSRESNTSK